MSEPAPAGKVVLIVDDTANTRVILGHTLRSAGYQVVEAENGPHALRLLEIRPVDLVILDAMMPMMDGFALCRRLRAMEATKGTPILMCTAKGQKEDVVQALNAGANDYILKPFTKATILERVKKFLEETPAPPA